MYNFLVASNSSLGYGVATIAEIDLNWIGKLIRILIEGVGIFGVGIILFTLILKTIVLPLDIFSRINGKKQALIMERMRPRMEKLQKQYANDKNMYNQKVLELQRSSGYSMLGSCLPMIVSLVIFIIVFNAFSTYSQYANLKVYNDMVGVYNETVQTYVVTADNPDGFLYAIDESGNIITYAADGTAEGTVYDYKVDYEAFEKYYIKENSLEAGTNVYEVLATSYKESHTSYSGAVDFSLANDKDAEGNLTVTAESIRNTLINYYMEGPAAAAVEAYYESDDESNNSKFLWVKNIWYPDSTLYKEWPSFAKFQSTISKASISDDYSEIYEKVTANLGDQKDAYNGYFVLIVLSILLMLLQQWLSMRSNKSVNDLSTVDGSGARTNKMMLVMMPIIYGIFSFFYSAAFSIYMITNTLYSLLTMLIINKCVDIWFKKKEANGQLEEILTKKNKKKKGKSAPRR